MTQKIGPAGAVAVLAWTSEDCPACGRRIGATEVQHLRVMSSAPDIVSFPLCADCQTSIGNGDDADFGRIVRAAERAVESAVVTAEMQAIEGANSVDSPKYMVH